MPAICAALFSALAVPASTALGGSTKPNYPAMKIQAEKARADLKTVSSHLEQIGSKLSDSAFRMRYEELVRKHDAAGLNEHFRKAGFTIASPLVSTAKFCSNKVCEGLPASLDDWKQRRAKHSQDSSKLDSFFAKISQDKAFGERVEQFIMKNDRSGLLNFFQEFGFPRNEIEILALEPDARIKLNFGFFSCDCSW
ncbi:MAG: hypothetical protein NEA02_16750 [Thermoanaerobaculia bacterium]|nr:hypothetical protein [Thermoanaerobaculia bacterium]